jgi:hypothetical protein
MIAKSNNQDGEKLDEFFHHATRDLAVRKKLNHAVEERDGFFELSDRKVINAKVRYEQVELLYRSGTTILFKWIIRLLRLRNEQGVLAD